MFKPHIGHIFPVAITTVFEQVKGSDPEWSTEYRLMSFAMTSIMLEKVQSTRLKLVKCMQAPVIYVSKIILDSTQ